MRRRPVLSASSTRPSTLTPEHCGISPTAITVPLPPPADGMPAPGSAAQMDRKSPTPSDLLSLPSPTGEGQGGGARPAVFGYTSVPRARTETEHARAAQQDCRRHHRRGIAAIWRDAGAAVAADYAGSH